MEYVYAALILHESGEEINEDNLTGVLEAASVDVDESRVKALVAALEDVDVEDAIESGAAVPAGGSTGGAPAADADGADEAAETDEDDEDEEEAAAEEAADEPDEEDEEAAGEGLGDLFG